MANKLLRERDATKVGSELGYRTLLSADQSSGRVLLEDTTTRGPNAKIQTSLTSGLSL